MAPVSRNPNGLAPTPHQIHFSNKDAPLQFKSKVSSTRAELIQSIYLCMPTGYDLLNIHFVNECPKKIQTPLVPSPEFHTSRPQHLTASCSFPSFSTACSLSPSAVITSFHRMYFLSFQQMILFLKCAFFAGIILSSVLLWVPWESMEMLKLSRAQALINQIPFPTRLKQLLSVKIHQVYFCCLLRS